MIFIALNSITIHDQLRLNTYLCRMTMEPKTQQDILYKLGINTLNTMQLAAAEAIESEDEVLLLSPTGSGKTLAFLLPIIATLDPQLEEVQCLIVVPTRELAMQIEQVTRQMGTGYKVNAVYGGRAGYKDQVDLRHRPAILVGTPGRLADHLRRENFSADFIQTLVLDEYDKSLEIGFESEMKEIVAAVFNLNKKILTSATPKAVVPDFVGFNAPKVLDYLQQGKPQLRIRTVSTSHKDKLEGLFELLCHLGNQPGIIFCNFKDSIQRVSEHLSDHGIAHGCFHGGMEQQDRETALVKFRNGTHQLLLATDLAARGIDIPEIRFIIHYHLPMKEHEFVHRNGRTARMFNDGTAYVLHWERERLLEFVSGASPLKLERGGLPAASDWETIMISGGRKDKISKSDIAGLFFKQAQLTKDELGAIELKQDVAFVAVKKDKTQKVIQLLDNTKLKNTKIRLRLI